MSSADMTCKICMHTHTHTHTDIVVDLRWADNTVIRASLVGFTRLQASKFPTDVQDISIQIETPTGSNVREGLVHPLHIKERIIFITHCKIQ